MSAEPSTAQSTSADTTEIFEQLKDYKWDEDSDFKGGLKAILGNTTDPSQIQELTLRAQCFYFTRKFSQPIDFDAYKAYLSNQPTSTTDLSLSTSEEVPPPVPPHQTSSLSDTTTSEPEMPHATHEAELPLPSTASASSSPAVQDTAPYPSTFAEIVELITSGAPIPGIKEIPPTLLTSQATKPVAPKRRKPWEKDVPEEAVQGAGAVIGEGKVVEGTFGDRRDEAPIEQELPEELSVSGMDYSG